MQYTGQISEGQMHGKIVSTYQKDYHKFKFKHSIT